MTNRIGSVLSAIVDIVLVSTMVFASLPLAITLNMRVASIPILNGFLLATALSVITVYFRLQQVNRTWVSLYLVGGILLCAVTVLNWDGPNFDFRAGLTDLFTFAALPLGIALAQAKGQEGFLILLRRICFAVGATFLLSMGMLLAGMIQSTGGDERRLDGAMYTSSFIIAVSFPAVWSGTRAGRFSNRLVAVLGLVLVAAFALISATRSVLIEIVIALMCTAIVAMKRDRKNVARIAVAVLALIGIAITGSLPGMEALSNSTLAERLLSTDYQSEVRYEELTGMFEQMSRSTWVIGSGFGTGFASPVNTTDLGIAFFPHIAITTLLFKGGIFIAFGLMWLPSLIGTSKLLFSSRSTADPFAAGVTIYFILACLSGGWAFIPLFLFGAFFWLTIDPASRRSGGRIMVVERVRVAEAS